MKSLVKSCLAFLLLAHAADAFAQPVVGRVLVAAGQVTLVRQGTPRAAIAATGLQVGDAVVTSAASNAQIGFVDHSVVALRESSHFLVERFQFQPEGGSNALAFSLLRGGLRTVTGLIGVSRRADEYRVKTPIASVGIRGTQYSLVYCQDDCADPEGVLAANGAYGGVYDGTVAVSNNAGEVEFGRDEYFYVADINTIPQPLLGPPSFLGDRLKGMAKNAPKPAAEPAARSADGAASASQEAEAALPPTAAYVATETRGPGGAPAVVGGAADPSSIAFAFAHSLIETNGAPASYGGAVSIGSGPGDPTNPLTLSGSGPSQTLVAFDFSPTFLRSGSVGAAGIDMQGFDPASGLHWGRWVNGTIVVGAPDENLVPGTQMPPTGVHYLYGTATPDSVLASKTGSFTFSDFAGTTPTDSNGQLASSFAFGAINVNFTSRTANLSSLNISFPNATWSYSNLPFAMQIGGSLQDFSHLSAFAYNVGSCVGAGCGLSQGPNNATIDATGVFVGASANFLGMTLQGFSGAFLSPGVAWTAVRVYRCAACP